MPENATSSYMTSVFSIPPGCDFLKELVSSFVNGDLIPGHQPINNPASLIDATFYVPNRRTARALALTFLGILDGEATLLPTIRTLGDVDDDEFGLMPDLVKDEFQLKPVAPLDRTLELAGLIRYWKNQIAEETRRLYGDEDIVIPTNPADSIYMAADLSSLLRQIIQEETEWSKIRKIVPEEHAEWWRLTTTFLQIVMENWPDHLKERGMIDPDELAISQLKRRVKSLDKTLSKGPVIAAGTTGSVPSTQALLKAIATQPNGAVVLPGVDLGMREDEWQRLSTSTLVDDPLIETHPQYGLARTLSILGIDRKNVTRIGDPNDAIKSRNHLISIALAMSDFTADWFSEINLTSTEELGSALDGVKLIEAVNERQEAMALAIVLREALETKNKTAALVTPDRNLAKRVSGELERFNIHIDDSAGVPLAQKSITQFFRILASLCFGTPSNPLLVSLLKSHFCLAGKPRHVTKKLAQLYELVAIRGVIEQPIPGQLENHLNRRRTYFESARYKPYFVKTLGEEDWSELIEWAKNVDSPFDKINELSQTQEEVSINIIMELLRTCALKLSLDETGKSSFGTAPGAKELEQFLEDLLTLENNSFTIKPSDFPTILDALLEGVTCRTNENSHPRLHILGPLEARLLDYDLVCLAGLNEDTWPQGHRGDPFLNRGIRRELGIPSPERRTGLAAHDFQQLIAKKEVVLSRSGRVDKAPTIASRWLQRLQALAGEETTEKMRLRGAYYLELSKEIDRAGNHGERAKRPEPTPPVDSRPTELPVTDIETWIRDPYALYAKRVLKLQPLDPLERDPDPLLKGTLYHAIMEDYIKANGTSLPLEKKVELLSRLVREKLIVQNLPKEIEQVWITRFDEIATAYVEWENKDQKNSDYSNSLSEVDGKVLIGKNFTLKARADRLDISRNGTIRVLDYKTGNNPSPNQARSLSPQLALEGYIARKGGFEKVSASEVDDLMFVRLKQGKGFKVESIKSKRDQADIASIINNASEKLAELINAYQNPDQGYISRYAPFKDSEMSGDYDHLARTREWSFGEDEGDE